MQKCCFVFLSCFITICADAQRITAEQYIEQYKGIAIGEMKRMGIPAAITLAQGLLETESGNSELVKKSNNHFGIKCKNTWTGASVTHDDDATGECFRAYETAEESFRDHSNFLRGNARYGPLFRLAVADYRSWAYGLKRAGYATNPLYPEILIKNIEQYNLQQYTLQGSGESPGMDSSHHYIDSIITATISDIKDTSSESILDLPNKILTINKCKCVLAGKGVSLLVIAMKNKVNLNKLLEFNELAEDGILAKDQYVYLQKKSKTGEKDYYIVQEGEGIYDIAQKNGIQLQYLLDYNNLKNADAVRAGTILSLKPGLKPAGKEKAGLNKVKIHIVAAKEGLYAIARKYNVSVQQLKEWNNLSSNELKIGQQLIVSE